MWATKLILIAILIALVGCFSSRGYLERIEKRKDGSEVKTRIKLPGDVRDSTPITISADGVQANISGNHKPDAVAKQTTRSGMAMASAFAFAAVGLLVVRFKFPIIPLIAPVACGCASVAFFVLPTIVDRYSTEIAIAGALVLIWTVYEAWHQRRLHAANPGSAVGLAKWLKHRGKEQ
jgi:hypothetical protein